MCLRALPVSDPLRSKIGRRAAGLPDSLVRLSVGIEDVRDLVEDLAEGLGAVTRATVLTA